jgi:hypothetical protein
MRRGRISGRSGGRNRGRFDIKTGSGHRIDELAPGAGGELHRGFCRGTGERQPRLRACARARAAGRAAAGRAAAGRAGGRRRTAAGRSAARAAGAAGGRSAPAPRGSCCGRAGDHAVRQGAWIGGVGDGQSGGLGDLADDHLDGILVGLEHMRRGRVRGNTGGRDGGGFDINTGDGHHVDELAARAGCELHGGRCRGAGEYQAGLRRRRRIALGNSVRIAAVSGAAGGGCGIVARAVVASRNGGEQRAQCEARENPVSHYYRSTSQRPGLEGFCTWATPSIIPRRKSRCRTSVTVRAQAANGRPRGSRARASEGQLWVVEPPGRGGPEFIA